MASLQIGRVSEKTGLTVDAIRFYEKQKLLRPASRSAGGFRLFTEGDLRDIQFIRRAQALGFSLQQIRELLLVQKDEVKACPHVRELLRSKMAAVRRKIEQLRRIEEQLETSLKKCERKLKGSSRCHARDARCPVLSELAFEDAQDWRP